MVQPDRTERTEGCVSKIAKLVDQPRYVVSHSDAVCPMNVAVTLLSNGSRFETVSWKSDWGPRLGNPMIRVTDQRTESLQLIRGEAYVPGALAERRSARTLEAGGGPGVPALETGRLAAG